MEQAGAATLSVPEGIDMESLGVSEAEITSTIDVRCFLTLKRQAMAAHASQISETSVFLALPDSIFELVWGNEWFIRRGGGRDPESTLFSGLDRWATRLPEHAWSHGRAWKASPEFRERMAQVLRHVDEFHPAEVDVVATAADGASSVVLPAANTSK